MSVPSMQGPGMSGIQKSEFSNQIDVSKEIISNVQGICREESPGKIEELRSRLKDIVAVLKVLPTFSHIHGELQAMYKELQKKDFSKEVLSQCSTNISKIYEQILGPQLESPVGLDYYHGSLDQLSAERLLKDPKLAPGSFLVRDSSKPGAVTISYKTTNPKIPVGHTRVAITPKGYEIQTESQKFYFKSIPDLINHSSIFKRPVPKIGQAEANVKDNAAAAPVSAAIPVSEIEAKAVHAAPREALEKQLEAVNQISQYIDAITKETPEIVKKLAIELHSIVEGLLKRPAFKDIAKELTDIKTALSSKSITVAENSKLVASDYRIAAVYRKIIESMAATPQVSGAVVVRNKSIPKNFWINVEVFRPFAKINFVGGDEGGVFGFDSAYLEAGQVKGVASENNIRWSPEIGSEARTDWQLPTEHLTFNKCTFLINGLEELPVHFINLKMLELSECDLPLTNEEDLKQLLKNLRGENPKLAIVLDKLTCKGREFVFTDDFKKWCAENQVSLS